MLKVKLFQRGKKHQRTYRIVIAEARSNRDGRYIDDLGFWNPQINKLQIDKKKLKKWLKNGAQLTDGVKNLIDPKAKKAKEKKKELAKKTKKEAVKKQAKPKEKPEKAKEEKKKEAKDSKKEE